MNYHNIVIKNSLTLESLVYFNTENQKLKHKLTACRLFSYVVSTVRFVHEKQTIYVGASQQV